MISVVVLQNHMDLLNSEPRSYDDRRITSTLDGKKLIGIEAERLSDISEEADQETTIPAIKTEPNISGMPVVSVMDFSYRTYINLSSIVSVCPCEKKKRNIYFVTLCLCSTTCSRIFHPPKIKYSFHFIWEYNVNCHIEGITCFEEL